MRDGGPRLQHDGLLARTVGRPAFWVAAVAALFCAPLVRALRAPPLPGPPPVLGTFPSFALADDRGVLRSSADLGDRAMLVNLLCAHCPDRAAGAETMAVLQHRSRNLGDSIRLVSFSPDGDAASLSAIRRLRPASGRWEILAGAPPDVRSLFPTNDTLLLVDGARRIRGRYSAGAAESLDRALRDAARVAGAE